MALHLDLNDNWIMCSGSDSYECSVPCSVYKTLIENNVIPDPYYRDNEIISTPVCDNGYTFEKTFTLDNIPDSDKITVTFFGIDTLAVIYLNGKLLGSTDNMHRTYEFDADNIIKEGENVIRAVFRSPNKYIAEMNEKRPLWGVEHCMEGYTHIRKAHCMFGWDWGPKLPDMGVWRDVTLNFFKGGRINHVYYSQRHSGGKVFLSCRADYESYDKNAEAVVCVTAPDGIEHSAKLINGEAVIKIDEPQLWWVRGLGSQPLYDCRVELIVSGQKVDEHFRRIGLRTLTISQEKDEFGEEFCFINNGVKIFAMGANYIPEDQIVTRCTKEKTVKLLEQCKAANYNFIRVWGGGYYPDEYFYDWCDENGFIVWQDFMFACSAYLLTPEFESTVRAEIKDNIIRLRNHASLGLWCGNNEIESAWVGWGLPDDPEAKADYLRLFEDIIPSILKEFDPQTFYHPSSPSSGGGFNDPSSNRAGDMHYWDVWHNFKPIEAFKEHYYRFCSEYGFESIPEIKTVLAFADEEQGDLDLFSKVMRTHQKCTKGNEKIIYYQAQVVDHADDFRRLIYCSQLVQADCIRSNVEHMRRARGRCMGSAYWQVNDSNPVISWSSIDYFGRWKALHYAAKKFYAPILISAEAEDPHSVKLYVTNDTLNDEELRITCNLRNNKAELLETVNVDGTANAMSAEMWCDLNLTEYIPRTADMRNIYIEYKLFKGGKTVGSGTLLFIRPKSFEFLPANIQFAAEDKGEYFELVFTAENFAKSVCLSLKDYDCVFSDNWFDIHGKEPVAVTVPKSGGLENLTADELSQQLQITSY